MASIVEIVKAKINSITESLVNPAEIVDLRVDEAKKELNKVKTALGEMKAEEKIAERKLKETEDKQAHLISLAKTAKERGEMTDAEKLIIKKNELNDDLQSSQKILEACKTNTTKLQNLYDKLQEQIAKMEGQASTIKAQSAVAKAHEKVNATIGNTSLKGFDDLAAKTEKRMEAAIANSKLGSNLDSELDDLEAKYGSSKSLSGMSVADELANL